MMRNVHFWLKLALFGVPFFLVGIVSWGTAIYVGDGLPFGEVIRRQSTGESVLYAPPWQRDDQITYQMFALRSHEPDIALLGTSRGQSVVSGIFNMNPDSFYNASVAGLEIADMYAMIQYWTVEGTLPDYLFLQLDFPRLLIPLRETQFNLETSVPLTYDVTFVVNRVQETLTRWVFEPRLMIDLVQRASQNPQILGSVALRDNAGFARDGSYYFPDLAADIDMRLQAAREGYHTGWVIYTTGNTINEQTLADIHAILEIAQNNGVMVIGYMPPMRSVFYEKLLASGDYGYIEPGMTRLAETFAHYQMPFFDFLEMDSFGGRDVELYDIWHPGTLANARMYYIMLQTLPALAPYVDLEALNRAIQNSPDRFYPFGREP